MSEKNLIETYLAEYNNEYDNAISPNQLVNGVRKLTLVYKTISKYEVEAIEQFCKIYNLRFVLSTSHNEIFYSLYTY